MSSAIFALSVNVAIAGLFAAIFLSFSWSKGAPSSALWLAFAYLVGMLTPMCELAVPFTTLHDFYEFGSYATFVAAFLITAIALASHFEQPVPWMAIIGIGAVSVCLRISLWDGPRSTLPYELFFQLPFAAATLLCCHIALRSGPKFRSERAIVIVFAVTSAHFVMKAFAATWVGSGKTAQAYATSPYALISQSATAILLVAVGLILLFDVFRRMLSTANAASEIDALSGILNRRGLEAAAGKLSIQSDAKSSRRFSLLLFDLDHFKRINDTFGHAVGDEVIRRFAELLRENCPPHAVVARIGGEEFVVLIENCNGAMARMSAETIRLQLERSTFADADVRTSVGISSTSGRMSLPDLLRQADSALYAAKSAGRNCIRSFCDSELKQDNSQLIAGAAEN